MTPPIYPMTWRFVLSEDADAQDYSLDSAYTPTMDEWKNLTDHDFKPRWVFQANGAYLVFTLTGVSDSTNDTQGYYRVEAEIDNEYKFYNMAYIVDRNKRVKIKGAWPAMIKEGNRKSYTAKPERNQTQDAGLYDRHFLS